MRRHSTIAARAPVNWWLAASIVAFFTAFSSVRAKLAPILAIARRLAGEWQKGVAYLCDHSKFHVRIVRLPARFAAKSTAECQTCAGR